MAIAFGRTEIRLPSLTKMACTMCCILRWRWQWKRSDNGAMQITLDNGPHGTFLITAEDGRDLLIQTDWDYPSVASSFGWNGRFSKKKYGTGPSGEIHAAADWLSDNIGAEAEDPGYFDLEADERKISWHGNKGWESQGQRVAPHIWVISKDTTGAYIVSIGDPLFATSTLKQRFSGKHKKQEMADWVRDNVGTNVSRSHIVDWTSEFLNIRTGQALEPGAKPASRRARRAGVGTVHAGECVVLTLTGVPAKLGSHRRVYLVVCSQGVVASVLADSRGLGALDDLGHITGAELRKSMHIELAVPVSTLVAAGKLRRRAMIVPGRGAGTECLVAHLDAGHDKNGNPRRLFLVFDHDGAIAAVDEGYEGAGAMDTELGKAVAHRFHQLLPYAARLAVAFEEYRDLLHEYGPAGHRRKSVQAVCK